MEQLHVGAYSSGTTLLVDGEESDNTLHGQYLDSVAAIKNYSYKDTNYLHGNYNIRALTLF